MEKPILVHCAVWHHRHGVDVFLSRTEEGRLKSVAEQVILMYLDEIPREEDQKQLKSLCEKGQYEKALQVWGECRDDEYVDFYDTHIQD